MKGDTELPEDLDAMAPQGLPEWPPPQCMAKHASNVYTNGKVQS